MVRSHVRRPDHAPDREGAILLIVLVMLALFAVVGLLFVSYSQSQATSAQVRRAGLSTITEPTLGAGGLSDGAGSAYPADPKSVVDTALRHLIYPVNDTGDDLLIAARGYDMATMVYGNRPGDLNSVPYNGIGGFHEATSVGGLTDRVQVVNYSYIPTGFFDPERTGSRTNPATPPPAGSVYAGRNAGYSYPDRNNAYIAVIDPDTGMVLAPSFHRPGVFGTLAQSNANWTNTQGRYMILRPRPQENPGFPFPPPNPDGTITGDVPNLVYKDGRQQNDSIWMDFNLPVVDYQGKKVKALIAPMIIPLDGRLNLLAHGNLKGPSQTTASNMGFGPWEVDLGAVLGADASAVIAKRYSNDPNPATAVVPSPRGSSLTTLPFASVLPPNNSRVDFDAAGTAIAWTLPTGFQSDPAWPADPFGNGDLTTEASYHPGLYNPYQWDPEAPDGAITPRSFPVIDLREMAGRYSDDPRNYGASYLGREFPVSLGQPAGSGPNSPADLRRALLTSISNSLARPGLAPTVFGGGWSGSLQLDTTPGKGFPVFSGLPTPDLPNSSTYAGPTSDILNGTPTAVRNIRAALGAVDLNRPLADYRGTPPNTTTPWPLDPSTVTNYNNATTDRQRFAMDIFTRLVIATGAAAAVNTDPTTGMPYIQTTHTDPDPEYQALRWLAQLSANIVDYVDSDDVMTTFVWNPGQVGTNYLSAPLDPTYIDTAVRKAIVVYGVERPRLVVNEVYAELTNDPADKAQSKASNPFRVRFFIELLNPSSVDTSAPVDPSSPLAVLNGGTPIPLATPLRYTTDSIEVYKLEVYQNAATVGTSLQQADNVDGSITTAATLTPSVMTNVTADVATNADYVEPNNNQFNATTTRNGFAVFSPNMVPGDETDDAYSPDPANDPFKQLVRFQSPDPVPTYAADGGGSAPTGTIGLEYAVDSDMVKQDADVKSVVLDNINANRHAVVLRRLACPYVPFDIDTNPYITVDYMGQVKVQDAVSFLTPMDMMDMDNTHTPDANEYWGIGRVQPYAGFQGYADTGTGVMNPENLGFNLDKSTYNVTQVLTLPQQLVGGQQKIQTLFQHNSTMNSQPTASVATLILPFEWLVHLDRKLVNAVDLLHVSGVKPHELLHEFARPSAGSSARPWFHRHDLQHRTIGGPNPIPTLPDGPLFDPASPLYRMFEVLTVKPWTYGIPNGGRQPGRVNVNMLWDQGPSGRSQVFDALFHVKPAANSSDPQLPNKYTLDDLNAIWAGLKQSRSPAFDPATTPDNWLNNTFAETVPLAGVYDQPIHSFGAPLLSPAASFPNGSGLADTLLRPRLLSDGLPLFRRIEVDPANPLLHPYEAYEPMRKVYNNVSTTTDCYLVIMTVGWFDVTNASAAPYSVTNPPQLGAETYRQVPGDLRTKVVAVIDRTQLGVDPAGKQVAGVAFSELANEVLPSATGAAFSFPASPAAGDTTRARIYMDHGPRKNNNTESPYYLVEAGVSLRLGTGDAATGLGDGEWVNVTGVTYDATTGLANVTVSATTRYHPAGSAVGNAFLRNPGRPEDFGVPFNYEADEYKGVVPFVAELRPSQ